MLPILLFIFLKRVALVVKGAYDIFVDMPSRHHYALHIGHYTYTLHIGHYTYTYTLHIVAYLTSIHSKRMS